jgi:type I restriction enzyme S subunit
MGGECPRVQFGKLLADPVRNGIYKTKEFHGRGVKIVNMGELFANPRLRSVSMRRVELSNSERERFSVSEGDLLFARRSLVAEGAGKCIVVLAVDEPTTFESSIIRARPDGSMANSLYLYYFFNSATGFHALDTIRRQVAVAGITGSDLSRLEIPLPPLPIQQRIADILGSLDDKIELNRRTNETLEAMARALFKSWFVDFDPVVAKSEGRHPDGMDAETAQLFPSSFEDSEIGRVPKGWRVKPFSHTVDILSGGTPKTSVNDYWGGNIPWFSVVDTPSASDVFVMATEKTITQEGIDGSATHVLPIGTTIITARGTVGKTCIVGVPMAMNQSCFGLLGKSSKSGQFTYYSTRFLVSTLQNYAHGSVFATINRNTFDGVNAIEPPRALVIAFEDATEAQFCRIRSNLKEIHLLNVARDTLLPRLLSGELTVSARRST